MKILHTSDWHLGKNLDGAGRMDEQELFLKDFVNIVKKNEADLVIIAGDIYDSSNPPARAEKMFYDTLKKISCEGKVLTLIISGNHDNPDRLSAAGPLAQEHGIIICGTPKTVIEPGKYGKHKVVNSGEGFIEIEFNKEGKRENCVILTVPYPSEKRLNEVIYKNTDSEEDEIESYNDRIKRLFDNLKVNFRKDTVNLIVSHLFVELGENKNSENSVEIGGSYAVTSDCFPEEAQYIALGHIHKKSVIQGTGKRARYCGAPLHYNKREIKHTNICYLADIKPQEEAQVEEIQIPVYKPIEIWKCKNADEAVEMCRENSEKNCWVYLEIETDEAIREDQMKEMKKYKKDILEIHPIIKSDAEYEEEIENIKEKSFEELFTEFYKKEKKIEPDTEILEILREIVCEESGEKDEAD